MMSRVTRRATPARPYGARAHPLPPEERRRHIIDVALAQVRRTGAMPSTRELAFAAEIAEGTLFRAFGTKDALQTAMISAVACPYTYRAAADAIPAGQPLRDTLLAITTLLWERFIEIFETLGPLGVFGPPPHGPHPGCPGDPPEPLGAAHFRAHTRRLLAPFEDELRVPVDELVDAMRYLCFAGSNRGITDGRLMAPDRIVALLLDGALSSHPPAGGLPAPPQSPQPAPHPSPLCSEASPC